MVGISRSLAYQIVAEGLIRSRQIKRRIVIPLSAIDEFLAGDPSPNTHQNDAASIQ